MKIVVNLMIIVFLFGSCSAQNPNSSKIMGNYQSQKKEPNTELILTKDNRFKYRQTAGLYDSKSEGIWKIEKERLVLISDSIFKTNMIEVSEIEEHKKRNIKVYDETGNPCLNAVIKIKNTGADIVGLIDQIGVLNIEANIKVEAIEVNYLGENHTFKPQKKNSSYFIKLYTDNLDKKYFDQEIVRVKKNALFLDNIKLLRNGSD